MNGIGNMGPNTLTWVQPSRRVKAYVLQSGGVPLVSIGWERGSHAVVESPDGWWSISRRGMIRQRVTIRTADSEVDLAVFHGSWDGGGRLEFRDGRTYDWNNTNWRHTSWVWTDRSKRPLLRFKGDRMFVEPAGATMRELPLLAALSWYLNIMTKQDAMSAVVVPVM